MAEHKHHGGRTVESPHSPEHYEDIETPFIKHDKDGHEPFHGSHPDHYPHHSEHVKKHQHGR